MQATSVGFIATNTATVMFSILRLVKMEKKRRSERSQNPVREQDFDWNYLLEFQVFFKLFNFIFQLCFFVNGIWKGLQDYYQLSSGFYIQVNQATARPLVKYSGFTIPTGEASTVEVVKRIHKDLEYPYSYCRKDLDPLSDDSVYYNLTTNIKMYNQKTCVDIYYQINLILPNCKCYDPSSQKFDPNSRICQNKSEIGNVVLFVYLVTHQINSETNGFKL